MAGVSMRDVRKVYGTEEVVHGVDIDISDGEFVTLVGPSGCGKSTLLRMVAGLESLTSGQIMIGPDVVNDVEPKDRDIAMVFQNYALYPHRTIAQNMGFALKMQGLRKDAIQRRVEGAADILGLKHLLGRYPRELSGGQRQRVAMGRAIVREPRVFLFDEPLSNLDAKLRVAMRTEIKALHQRLKTTMIYVTHDQIEAMTMADRIVVLHDGRIEQIGTPLDLYDSPENRFVAGFIGSPAMNMFEGTISDGPAAELVLPSGRRLPLGPVPAGWRGMQVCCGVRPEHLGLTTSASAAARVLAVEPTGSETHVVLDVGDCQATAVVRERVSVRVGDVAGISPRPERIHFFDRDTGRRLAPDGC